jgi:hypothetical protein
VGNTWRGIRGYLARNARRPLRPPRHSRDSGRVGDLPPPCFLLERLKLVREGAEVLIRYTGKQTSKAGRIFKAFEVFVSGADALNDTAEFDQRFAVGDES